jgi:hypothetical protein
MRFSRLLFGLPIACLMLAAAALFAAPSHPAFETVAAYHAPPIDLGQFIVAEPAKAILAEAEVLTRSRADAHAVEYSIANQPGSTWRFAADSYSHIDPHILAAT